MPRLWHRGSSKKHWAAFHALDGCRLRLSSAQPNHKSSLPGEPAALTPALCLSTLALPHANKQRKEGLGVHLGFPECSLSRAFSFYFLI